MNDRTPNQSIEALKNLVQRVAQLNRESVKKREANARTIQQAQQ